MEQLSGKVVAVDVSVWLVQFIKAMRDADGMMMRNAHLLGFLRRCLKLMYYNIKPVFVFDGATPYLKRRTILARNATHDSHQAKLRRVAEKVLMNRVKIAAIDHIQNANTNRNETGTDEESNQCKAVVSSSDAVELDLDEENDTVELNEDESVVEAGSSSQSRAAPRYSKWRRGLHRPEQLPGLVANGRIADLNDLTTPGGIPLSQFILKSNDSDDELDDEEELLLCDEERVDLKSVAELPLELQIEVFDALKLRRRVLNRSQSAKQAADPTSFSTAQVDGFLKAIRLNKRIKEARGYVDSGSHYQNGSRQRIASDSRREFVFNQSSKSVDKKKQQEQHKNRSESIAFWQNLKSFREYNGDGVEKTGDREENLVVSSNVEWATKVLSGVRKDSELLPIEKAARVPQYAMLQRVDDGDDEEYEDGIEWEDAGDQKEEDGDEEIGSVVGIIGRKGRKRVRFEDEEENASELLQEGFGDEYAEMQAAIEDSLQATASHAEIVNEKSDFLNGNEDGKSTMQEGEHQIMIAKDSNNSEQRKEQNAVLNTERNAVEDIKQKNTDTEPNVEQKTELNVEQKTQQKAEHIDEQKTNDIKEQSLEQNRASVDDDHDESATSAENLGLAIDESNDSDGGYKSRVLSGEKNQDVTGLKWTNDSIGDEFDGSNPMEREMDDAQLDALREEALAAQESLAAEARSLRGNAAQISSEMYSETRELLEMLGIPYLEAPFEAEAQCAWLNQEKLVDAVITEDSDAFLFGAKVVYRNAFAQNKFMEEYDARDFERELGLNRDLLIRMAMLLGSDYTEGVRGIGIVNATEIIHAFGEELEEFAKWVREVSLNGKIPSDSIENSWPKVGVKAEFAEKHRKIKRNWILNASFPSSPVIEAYKHPEVNTNRDKFAWTDTKVQELLGFCWSKFGWTEVKSNEILRPVLSRWNPERKGLVQMKIMDYFRPERFAKIKSQRLRDAVSSMAGEEHAENLALSSLKKNKNKKRTEKSNKKKKAIDETQSEES